MPETQDLQKSLRNICVIIIVLASLSFELSYNKPHRTSSKKVSLHTLIQTYPYYYHPANNHMELHSLYSYC